MKNTRKKDKIIFNNEVRLTASRDGEVIRSTGWIKNLVVLAGRNLLLQALSGDYTDSLIITHAEIGTGTTAAAAGDTATEADAVRAQKAYVSVVDDLLVIKFFFSDSLLPDDVYNEITMWMNGSAGVGTGHIFNRLMFSDQPYTKATGEDTTIEIRATLSA